ncbi:homoserine dehydrogenase [Virgibacillus doumboii]|uniref:homoserine dehydrogenase n=1 Tax=Virgibacillus doumboii TaxID=2697503 RepID=UPI0013DF71ED|nr:homoserine dehydrogenase [Virgibacillus doumboii]
MKPINVALIGLGTVGCGVFQNIHIHQQRLEELAGTPIRISTIVIENPDKHKKIATKANVTTDINDVLNDPEVDIVFEAIVGKEPAFTYLKKCIQANKHVITANKELFAAHGSELKVLANENHVKIGYEATTAGGIPIIQTIQQLLKANQVQEVQAILNGTTNFILTSIRENNQTFDSALNEAQKLGYAEADPTNDVEGFDALFKLMILSDLIFKKLPEPEYIKRIAVNEVTNDYVNKLLADNKRIKHIATLSYDSSGNLTAKVEPVAITQEHPLYAVEGVNNAVHIKTDIVGELTFTGPGAGAFPTASAMIEDFCRIIEKEQSAIPVI